MKGFVCVFVAMLLIPFGLTTAFADQSNVVEVQCPSDFFLTHVDCNEDGTFLLSGSTGTPMDSAPEMFGIDVNGHALWSIQGTHKAGSTGLYRSAAWLDNDTIIALCSEPNYPGYNTFVVQLIEQGEIVWQSEPMEGIMGVFPAPNGFLMTINRDAASASIIRMNFDGELLWQIDWPEWLTFKGILTRGDTHVAFGSKTIREGDREHDPTSVVIAFDDRGTILWRHDGLSSEEFTAAVWADQDGIILIGDTYGSLADALPLTDDRWGKGFIAKFTELGQVWRTDHTYHMRGTDRRITEGRMTSIIPVQDGYLASARVGPRYQTQQLLFIDKNGIVQKEWNEDMNGVYTYSSLSLHQAHNMPYLIASGYSVPAEPDRSFLDEPMMTILKKINIP
ncbi:hypothetical protein ACH6CV_02325 [Bacillota bacterium Meth-B3]